MTTKKKQTTKSRRQPLPVVTDEAMLPAFLNANQAAALCGYTRRKLYDLVERNVIPFCKPEGTRELRFEKAKVLQWLRTRAAPKLASKPSAAAQ